MAKLIKAKVGANTISSEKGSYRFLPAKRLEWHVAHHRASLYFDGGGRPVPHFVFVDEFDFLPVEKKNGPKSVIGCLSRFGRHAQLIL
jgi:hypothetical protein